MLLFVSVCIYLILRPGKDQMIDVLKRKTLDALSCSPVTGLCVLTDGFSSSHTSLHVLRCSGGTLHTAYLSPPHKLYLVFVEVVGGYWGPLWIVLLLAGPSPSILLERPAFFHFDGWQLNICIQNICQESLFPWLIQMLPFQTSDGDFCNAAAGKASLWWLYCIKTLCKVSAKPSCSNQRWV